LRQIRDLSVASSWLHTLQRPAPARRSTALEASAKHLAQPARSASRYRTHSSSTTSNESAGTVRALRPAFPPGALVGVVAWIAAARAPDLPYKLPQASDDSRGAAVSDVSRASKLTARRTHYVLPNAPHCRTAADNRRRKRPDYENHCAQTPRCHRKHLRACRRIWRRAALGTQTLPTRVLPSPHPKAT
jgi:hypothetical protein